MNILVEGNTPVVAATQDNAHDWIDSIQMPYTVTLDSVAPQPSMETYFGVPRDQFILVDLKTMRFISIHDADPDGAVAEIEGMLPPVDGGTPDM